MLSAELFGLAWYHINCPSVTGLRSVHLYLQQVLQAHLERTGLEKTHSIHGYHVLASDGIHDYSWGYTWQLSITNQRACEISATACFLKRVPAMLNSVL